MNLKRKENNQSTKNRETDKYLECKNMRLTATSCEVRNKTHSS